ncbi:DUF4153 domain-containing protein [Halodurantibacterium flavum]|uniref:DUF4153 domain-containing protein n=1 Tax=Halodurantibacterium flavum TaxID=1382802 RepID=A0ABW4S1Y3_9RHOB
MRQAETTGMRAAFVLVGTAAGTGFWLLVEVLGDLLTDPQWTVAVFSFAAVFFGCLLAMLGPLAARAVLPAAGLALVVAVALGWASGRHADPSRFFDLQYPGMAALILALVPMPFLIAARRRGEGWRNYAALFGHGWSIVARYAAAAMFVGIGWLVLWLSDLLLQVAGVEVIARLRDVPAFPYIFTGLAAGLALAVVHEFSDYVSPQLMLRLFRVLIPVVLVVVGVFLIALPLRGLESPFGGASVAGTLLSMAVGITLLVSSGIDASDDTAVHSPLLRLSVQGLALMLPMIAGLAVWAIWLRVGDFGWTPQRLIGAGTAAILLGYGLAYALSVLRGLLWGGRWMRHIRRANMGMAMILPVYALAWLTPLLHPERISAQSQLARYDAGGVQPQDLPLWDLAGGWGHAGQAVLDDLRVRADAGDEPLAAALARLDAVPRDGREMREGLRRDLLALMPVLPASEADVAQRIVAEAHPAEIRLWLDGCLRPTPGGNPGCVLVVADFLPRLPGAEAVLFYDSRGGFVAQEAFSLAGGPGAGAAPQRLRAAPLVPADAGIARLDALHQGDYAIAPPDINALVMDGQSFVVLP